MNTVSPNITYGAAVRSATHGSAVRSAALFWILSFLATAVLTTTVCLLGITPAWSAQPQAPSVTVSFRDLDLSNPAGATTLYRRIKSAAKQVCGYEGTDLISKSIWNGCYTTAIADAVGKVNSPLLTAIHAGRSPEMTAMLHK
jgi:UrcA family protein